MAVRPLVRRSSRLHSPPPRVLRRSRWRPSSKEAAATSSHTTREPRQIGPSPKRGPFFAPNSAFGCALGCDLKGCSAPLVVRNSVFCCVVNVRSPSRRSRFKMGTRVTVGFGCGGHLGGRGGQQIPPLRSASVGMTISSASVGMLSSLALGHGVKQSMRRT